MRIAVLPDIHSNLPALDAVLAVLGALADLIVVVRVAPAAKRVALLSFPRDLVVPIYCKDQSNVYTTDRINTAFTTCGPTGTLNTVEKLTGIPQMEE